MHYGQQGTSSQVQDGGAAARAAIKNGGATRRRQQQRRYIGKKGASKGHGREEDGQLAQHRLGGALSRAVRSREGASCAVEHRAYQSKQGLGPREAGGSGEGALGRPRLHCRHVTVQQPPPVSCLIMTVRGMRARIACNGAKGSMSRAGTAAAWAGNGSPRRARGRLQ